MTLRDAPAYALVTEALAECERQPQGPFNARTLVATQIVKACDCYDYQACETNDYDQSEAAALVDRVREEARHRRPRSRQRSLREPDVGAVLMARKMTLALLLPTLSSVADAVVRKRTRRTAHHQRPPAQDRIRH
jgi:hypothetical protein